MELSVLVTQMTILFILISCGFICGKCHLLKKEDIPLLSRLVLNVGIPGVVLSSVSDGCDLAASELFLYLAAFLAFNILCAGIAKAVVKLFRIKDDQRLYEFMYMFSNVGFMGLPVVQAVFGEEVLIYAVLFLLPNNLMLFSYGEYLIRDTRGFSVQGFFNPPVIASILAIVICILHLPIPCVIGKSISYLGSITTPLAMIIIGVSLNGVPLREALKSKELILFLAVKMLILPLVYWGILKALHTPVILAEIMVLMMAMPVPSNTVIYASIYRKNVSLASQASVLTSLVCMATIPVIFSILSFF